MPKTAVQCTPRWKGIYSSICLPLQAVCFASLGAMAFAQPTPPLPSCQPNLRKWVTTVWGFIFTLASLTADSWGSHKHNENSTIEKVVAVLIRGTPLNPILSLVDRFGEFWESFELIERLRGKPSASPYIPIFSGCSVFVNLSPTTYDKFQRRCHDVFEIPRKSNDFSDAIRIGSSGDTPEYTEKFLQLTLVGKEMLLRADVLPPVEQLKVLQGYSGFGMAVTVVQGVGYMYGVIVRLAQRLDVSPMEAIAFMLNIIVVMKGMMHFCASTCHRPLVVFLDGEKEFQFTTRCELHHQAPHEPSTNCGMDMRIFLTAIFMVLPAGVLVFFIVNSAKFLPFIVVVPLIIAEAGIFFCILCFYLMMYSVRFETVPRFGFGVVVPTVNVVSYVFALVVTVKYWNSTEFHIQSSNYIAQLLPYIG